MFNIDEKHFMPCVNDTGAFPSEKPRYTMTEEVEHTAREMRNTIDRLLKFEKRVEAKFEDLMKHLTSDNVLFKNTFAEAYNTFLMEVKNEVNVFEGNVDSSMSLFKANLESDYATLSEDCKDQIETYYQEMCDNFASLSAETSENITAYYNEFIVKLNAYKAELNETYDTFRDAIESRLTQYNDTYVESFNNYTSQMNTKLSAMEKSFNQNYSNFVNQVTVSITEFKNSWAAEIDARLDGQDSVINDALLYLKTNLSDAVETQIQTMKDSGEFASIIEGEVFTNLSERMNDIENALVTPEMFGAVGDGLADDTNAIKEAVADGKPVHMNGNYLVTEPIVLPAGTHITGKGTIRKTNTAMGTSSVNAVFYVSGAYTSIEGITISEKGVTAINNKVSAIVLADNAHHVSIENVQIWRFETGISTLGTTFMVNIKNVTCHFCINGFYLWSSALKTSIMMERCYANRCHVPYAIKQANYSTLISCGADTTNPEQTVENEVNPSYVPGDMASEYGIYNFDTCEGITVISCGSESGYSNGVYRFTGNMASMIELRNCISVYNASRYSEKNTGIIVSDVPLPVIKVDGMKIFFPEDEENTANNIVAVNDTMSIYNLPLKKSIVLSNITVAGDNYNKLRGSNYGLVVFTDSNYKNTSDYVFTSADGFNAVKIPVLPQVNYVNHHIGTITFINGSVSESVPKYNECKIVFTMLNNTPSVSIVHKSNNSITATAVMENGMCYIVVKVPDTYNKAVVNAEFIDSLNSVVNINDITAVSA